MTDITGESAEVELVGDAEAVADDQTYLPRTRAAGPPGGASAVTALVLGFVAVLGGGYSAVLSQWLATKIQEHIDDADLSAKMDTIAGVASGVIPAVVAVALGLYAHRRARTPWVSAAGMAAVLVGAYTLVVAALSIVTTLAEPANQIGF